MKVWLAIVTLAMAASGVALNAVGQEPARPPGDQQPRGDARIGEALAQRWCSGCHLVAGARAATDAAPPFQSIASDPLKTTAHLRGFLARPHAPMPTIPLSGTEVEDLIAYIRSTAAR